ncbi:hypothetical protein MNBD_NITROSPINAE04-1050 [hydrothermal vent metagenome]|uniref:Uncharacterized protein n=1 Tax=hydrothermal vent metagenome TaxID=652676 RepID=A0A3B1C835_9ZZZZ
MEQYVIPIILVVGIIGAALLTRWINWFTWGENRQREEAMRERIEAREATREKDRERSDEDA